MSLINIFVIVMACANNQADQLRSQNNSAEKKVHSCEIYEGLDRHANTGSLGLPV